MLQDRILSREEFLRLLQIRGTTLDWRVFKGEISLAFGCPINAHVNEYLPLDAVAVMMTSMLSRELGMKVAAAVVRESWDIWLRLVQAAESDPRLYKEPLPANDQQFLALGLKNGGPPKVTAGLMAYCLEQLNGYANIRGIAIQAVLRQLRTNARIYKVALPDRFTVSPLDPEHPAWLAEVAAYQKLAHARFKDKAKAKRAKARVLA
jgi:hypothetical protein